MKAGTRHCRAESSLVTEMHFINQNCSAAWILDAIVSSALLDRSNFDPGLHPSTPPLTPPQSARRNTTPPWLQPRDLWCSYWAIRVAGMEEGGATVRWSGVAGDTFNSEGRARIGGRV